MKNIKRIFDYFKMKNEMRLMRKYDNLVSKMEKNENLAWYVKKDLEDISDYYLDMLAESENEKMELQVKILMLENEIEEMKNIYNIY